MYKPDLIVLPITIHEESGIKKIQLYSAKELMKEGFLNASKCVNNTENIWQINCTEKNKNITSEDYVNWQNKLTEQNLNANYLVLYNTSAKDANATVVERADFDVELLVESVAYVLYTHDEGEAYYLTSILNSTAPNLLMKDFQAKGLFGARHVHKKILDIYFPKYDAKSKTHNQLAALSKTCHIKAAQYIVNNPPLQELSAMH